MAERINDLNDYEYPSDPMSRAGGADVDDEMPDPLEETPTGTVVVETGNVYVEDPSATEAEILQTRARFGAAIDEEQERLGPRRQADQAMGTDVLPYLITLGMAAVGFALLIWSLMSRRQSWTTDYNPTIFTPAAKPEGEPDKA